MRPLTNWNNLRHIRTRPLGEVGGHIKVLPRSIPALTLSHDESCKTLVVYVRQEVMRCLHEAIIATSPNWGSRLHQEMTTTWKFVTLNNIQLRRHIIQPSLAGEQCLLLFFAAKTLSCVCRWKEVNVAQYQNVCTN